MNVAIIIVSILLFAYGIWATLQWLKYRKAKKSWKSFEDAYNSYQSKAQAMKEKVDALKAQQKALEKFREEAVNQIDQLTAETSEAKERRDQIVEEVKTAFQKEQESRRTEFENQLQSEFETLKAQHDLSQYQAQIDKMQAEIDQAKATVQALEAQNQAAYEKEDFIATHSISLSEQDVHDISLIREYSLNLSRQEAFSKLIWTEFYQRPLQSLCKMLNVDKVSGIYKITRISDQRMYIGQAVDIGARWKEHFKCALGIGTTSYLSNKFYKAMHEDGPENYTFEILEPCTKTTLGERKNFLNERERYWIDFYNSTIFGFNTKIGG